MDQINAALRILYLLVKRGDPVPDSELSASAEVAERIRRIHTQFTAEWANRRAAKGKALAKLDRTAALRFLRCCAADLSGVSQRPHIHRCELAYCERCRGRLTRRFLSRQDSALDLLIANRARLWLVTLTQEALIGEAAPDAVDRLKRTVGQFLVNIGSALSSDVTLRGIDLSFHESGAAHAHAHVLLASANLDPEEAAAEWSNASGYAAVSDFTQVNPRADEDELRAVAAYVAKAKLDVGSLSANSVKAWAAGVLALRNKPLRSLLRTGPLLPRPLNALRLVGEARRAA